jgi:hypothetical protein
MRALDLLRLLLVFAGSIAFPLIFGALLGAIQPPGWLLTLSWFAVPYLGYRKTLLLMPWFQTSDAWPKYFTVHLASLLLTLLTLAIGLMWIWIVSGAHA